MTEPLTPLEIRALSWIALCEAVDVDPDDPNTILELWRLLTRGQ